MIKCQICKKLLRYINALHLRMHDTTVEEYKKKYPGKHLQCKVMRKRHSGFMEENKIGVGNTNAVGRIESEEQKERTSKRSKGNDYGIGNKSRTGMKNTEESKEKSRIRMLKMLTDGMLKPGMNGHCKMCPVKNHIGKTVKVQGELEVRFAKLLTRLGIRWRRPKKKIYELDGKEHYYFCDFWLPDERLYLEAKSRYVYNNSREKVLAKKRMMIERGKKKGFRYKIMFEKNIREFELNVVDVAETLIIDY